MQSLLNYNPSYCDLPQCSLHLFWEIKLSECSVSWSSRQGPLQMPASCDSPLAINSWETRSDGVNVTDRVKKKSRHLRALLLLLFFTLHILHICIYLDVFLWKTMFITTIYSCYICLLAQIVKLLYLKETLGNCNLDRPSLQMLHMLYALVCWVFFIIAFLPFCYTVLQDHLDKLTWLSIKHFLIWTLILWKAVITKLHKKTYFSTHKAPQSVFKLHLLITGVTWEALAVLKEAFITKFVLVTVSKEGSVRIINVARKRI